MSRENREATTFWMDEDTKSLVKQKARELDTTMTDLINDAVAYYLRNLSDIKPEVAMKELGREIMDAPRISQIEKEIEQLRETIESLSRLEKDVEKLEKNFEELKDQIEGDTLRNMISTQVAAQVGPTMKALSHYLDILSGGENEQKNTRQSNNEDSISQKPA